MISEVVSAFWKTGETSPPFYIRPPRPKHVHLPSRAGFSVTSLRAVQRN
jgi:hypothetical protein